MSITNQKLNISEIITIKYPGEALNTNPGRWMQSRNSEQAGAVFNEFVTKKMPQASKLIEQLNNTQHLSASHLPLNIYSIFLIYITEQIELYQNQLDVRDDETDKKFGLFKEAFAKERYNLLTRNPKWGSVFFDHLKALAKKTETLPQDFNRTIDVWQQLISIAHIGETKLASHFHPEAKTKKLLPLKSPHQHIYIDLQRNTLKETFYLVVKQLSQNLKGIEKLKDKAAFPHDEVLQKIFLASFDENNIEKNIHTHPDAFSVISGLGKFLKNALLLDLSNNDELEACKKEIQKICKYLACYADLSLKINLAQLDLEIRSNWPVEIQVQSEILSVSKENFLQVLSLMINWQNCHLFFDCHLSAHCTALEHMFALFIDSNEQIEKFYKEGIIPPSNPKPLLPPPSFPTYNEKVFRELCATPPPKAHTAVSAKKKANSNKQHQAVLKTTHNESPPTAKPAILPVEPPKSPALDSLEQLRRQLLSIYHTQPNVAIRQALWHLDKLMTLKETLKTPAMNKEGLTVLNLAASSAHKLLEQTYSFCLANRDIELLSSHNLKDYETALGNLSFPEVVQHLYLANHWTRYFYPQKQKWTFSTQVVALPTLIQDLIDAAEGKTQEKNSAAQKALNIIEKTRAHVETLLPQLNIAPPLEYLAEDVSIQPKLRFSPGNFNKVKTELTTFLTQSRLPPHHPAYLHIKQAIAALNILKGSLQAVLGAKTSRELATWLSLCVQQTHEALEDVLCGIEAIREGQVSSQSHNLKTLAAKLGLEMGELADACDHLSYKSRYPAENLSTGLGSQIIDDAEALRQVPEYLEGFKVVGKPPLLWKQPEKDPTLVGVMDKLCTLLKNTQAFLEQKAIPALQQR